VEQAIERPRLPVGDSLDVLTPQSRALLSLVLTQGKGFDEIAGLLGIDPAAVRMRAHGRRVGRGRHRAARR
jgi:DNA-directed RNA polymerase specialized sigma24 family protein